ncbi:MAG TPA: hypothetical protein DER64_12795, partial [Planctomycetaceae bacterium]|nr:hypothetical protein [Planctomycetaceae bacterium]
WAFVTGGTLLMGYGVFWHLVATPQLSSSTSNAATDSSQDVSESRPSADVRPNLAALFGNNTLRLLTLSYAAYGYFQYLF